MEHVCRECNNWEEHLYWTHIKSTQIRFCTLLTSGFDQGLVVPRKIVSRFREQLVNTATLKNLMSGKTWTIGLEKRDEDMVFQQGWADFVIYHSLKKGDIVTFQYGGDSTFIVSSFDGESGYEKVGLGLSPNLQTRETHFHMEYFREGSSSDSSSDETEGYTPSRKVITSGKGKSVCEVSSDDSSSDETEGYTPSRKVLTSGKGKSVCEGTNSRDAARRVINMDKVKTYPMYFLSGRRPVSMAEKEKAYQLACAFPSSSELSFIISMPPTSVCKGFFLTIPQYVRKHIPKGTKEVILRVPPGVNTWDITYNGVGLSTGWKNFVWDTNLEESDACVFQLTQFPVGNQNLKTIAMDVKIFRVVKKFTKLKKVSRNLLMKREEQSTRA